MAFVVEREVAAPPEQVFAAVADVSAHGGAIPWTRIETSPGDPGVGWRFTARSGPRAFALVDEMVLTRWEPGRRYALSKLGPLLRGWADIEVEATPTGSLVRWSEEIRPVVVGSLPGVGRLSDLLGTAMVRRALDVLLAGPGR